MKIKLFYTLRNYKKEYLSRDILSGIIMAAFFGVLILGTIYGVIIGIILSFLAVIIRATNPPRAFLGMIPGREGFFDTSKNRHAYELEHVEAKGS